MIVSYVTEEYKKYGKQLQDNLSDLGVPHYIEFMPSWGDKKAHKIYKPFFLEKMFEKYPDQNLMLVDGDAYMIKEVPELLSSDFSIGVTVRRSEDQVFEEGKCRVINAGVIMINDLELIDKWIARMKITQERFVEQTALTRMIFNDKTVPDYKTFPCDIYNYYWVQETIPETARILHFKGKGVKKRKGLLQ